MIITKKQLRKLIIEELVRKNEPGEDINISIDIPDRPGFSFSFKAEKNKVKAMFHSESGGERKLENNQGDKQLMLGALKIGLDTAKNEESKKIIIKSIARLFDMSEKEEDIQKTFSEINRDRKLASYSQLVNNPSTPLV